MIIGVTMLVISLLYLLLTGVAYFLKKRINNLENKIYSRMIITTLLGIILELSCICIVPKRETYFILNEIINKSFLIYILTWVFLFTKYIFIISFENKLSKNINNFSIIIYITCILGLVLSPLEYYYDGTYIYSYGFATNLLYIIIFISIIIWILFLLVGLKNVGYKKFIPLFTFIVGAIINMIIHNINPGILLITITQTFITIMMYFTIENPDMKMVEELNKNRKLTEQNFEEKSNFLFKISQDLKYPIKEVIRLSQEIIDNNNTLENAKKINLNSRQLYTYVNGALDVSQIDIKNLKIIEATYNSKNFFEQIKMRTETELKNKKSNIEFRINISKNIPEYICGDNVKIKQIILSIIFNSIKHTKNGFIELNVNSIVKYGICRLLIEITDCGEGMSLDKINNILNIKEELTNEDIEKIDKLNIDLALVHKMIKILNGNFIIKSEEGNGTNFLIIIDQVIDNNKNKKIDTMSSKLINQNSILLISDDKELSKKITDELKGVTTSLFVKDAMDKINDKTKYILIDNNLKEKSGINVLKELNTKIPCILLISEKEKFLSNHFIEDGFKDFMIKEYIEDELIKIKKHL